MSAARTIFLTGGTGFIGRHLLACMLEDFPSWCVYSLVRPGHELGAATADGVHSVRGDLFAAETYKAHLAESDTVVHLAAVTGKAAPDAYFRVNAEGTEFLLEQCREAGVKNFLYVSTIAVKYENKSRYLYAQSKEQGEERVKASGLNYCIVRPTIVLGRDAPAWKNFSKLGQLPLLPVLGNGRTRIQPILVTDLVNCLMSILNKTPLRNETLDLGGPEKTTIEDFLRRIYRKYHGKSPKVVHVPLSPLMAILGLMEPLLHSLMPINSGQLSAFRYDGVAEANRIVREHVYSMKNVDAMLQEMIGNGQPD